MSKFSTGKSTILNIEDKLHVVFLGLVLLPLEPLQTQNEYFGCLVYLHLLLGQDEILAPGTVPGILLPENLGLLE